jgi:hypothetical protein
LIDPEEGDGELSILLRVVDQDADDSTIEENNPSFHLRRPKDVFINMPLFKNIGAINRNFSFGRRVTGFDFISKAPRGSAQQRRCRPTCDRSRHNAIPVK